MNKPKIIISSGNGQDVDNYVNSIKEYNGNPIIISPNQKDSVEELVFDGLMLTGGGDISPSLYSQRMKSSDDNICFGTSIERDTVEFNLVKKALSDSKPILGICRGMQSVSYTHLTLPTLYSV